jgi:taurine dioxygenase
LVRNQQPLVRRLSPALGAELTQFDPTCCSDAEFELVHKAWVDADGVLVIRDAHMSPTQHIAFASRFGVPSGETRDPSAILAQYYHPQYPQIYRVSNKSIDGLPIGREDAGTYWHSDGSTGPTPSRCSLLHAIEIPPYGGDTQFASLTMAYEALSDTM